MSSHALKGRNAPPVPRATGSHMCGAECLPAIVARRDLALAGINAVGDGLYPGLRPGLSYFGLLGLSRPFIDPTSARRRRRASETCATGQSPLLNWIFLCPAPRLSR